MMCIFLLLFNTIWEAECSNYKHQSQEIISLDFSDLVLIFSEHSGVSVGGLKAQWVRVHTVQKAQNSQPCERGRYSGFKPLLRSPNP